MAKKKISQMKMNQRIKIFQDEFFFEFGVMPFVSYKDLQTKRNPGITIKQLEFIINNLLWAKYPKEFPGGIREVSRVPKFLRFRQYFFKICSDFGFNKSGAGRYLDKDHATVIHSTNYINKLIEDQEPLTLWIQEKATSDINYFLFIEQQTAEAGPSGK